MDTKNMDCIRTMALPTMIFTIIQLSEDRQRYHFSCKYIFGHNFINYILLIHHFMDNAIISELLQNVPNYELLSSG